MDITAPEFISKYGVAVPVRLDFDSTSKFYTTHRGLVLEITKEGYVRKIKPVVQGMGQLFVYLDGRRFPYLTLLADNHLNRKPWQKIMTSVGYLGASYPIVPVDRIQIVENKSKVVYCGRGKRNKRRHTFNN